MIINRKEFIDMLNKDTGKTKKELDEFVEIITDGIMKAVKEHGGVKFVGFGTFDVSHKKERSVKIPESEEKVVIEAHNSPHFRPGKLFKDLLN